VPNPSAGLFQTLTSAAMDLKTPLTLRKAMLSKVYIHDQPIPGTVGQVININIPTTNIGNATDIGAGAIQVVDASYNTQSIVVNKNISTARIIRDFTASLTPENLRQLYLAPAIEEVSQKANLAICSLVTSANFSNYTSISGGTKTFSRGNIANAWANLAGVGVPIEDAGNFHFVTSHVAYGNMLQDTNLINEAIVGINAAESAQQTARLMPAFGSLLDYDPQFPQPTAGSTYAGLLFHKNAIALAPVMPIDEAAPHVTTLPWSPPGSGFVFRIQSWYDPREQGQILHVHCMFGLAVVRPEYGSYLVSA
jgi:hypothetical protein